MSRQVNTAVADPCAECRGWGFYSISKDPDEVANCLECGGTGRRRIDAPTLLESRLVAAQKALSRFEDRNSRPNPGHLADALRDLIESIPNPGCEYGVTHVDPDRPVSIRETSDEARAVQEYYDSFGRFRSNIFRRTKATPAGPWVPVDPEGHAS